MLSRDTMFRRWASLVLLSIAGFMLVLGLTVLKSRLEGMTFMLYWLVCFFLTNGAIVGAWLDIRTIRKEAEKEQRDLFRRTFGRQPDDPSRS
jgi:hypothetical protein